MLSISLLALPLFVHIYILRLLAHFAEDVVAYSGI